MRANLLAPALLSVGVPKHQVIKVGDGRDPLSVAGVRRPGFRPVAQSGRVVEVEERPRLAVLEAPDVDFRYIDGLAGLLIDLRRGADRADRSSLQFLP